MRPLEIITAPPGSTLTLKTKSFYDDISSYVVILKRFTEDGGATVAVWKRENVERQGIAATLDKAHGFHLIIAAAPKPGMAEAKMRVQLKVGDDYQYDRIITVPNNDNVGWSVVMDDMVATLPHDPANAQYFGVISEPPVWP